MIAEVLKDLSIKISRYFLEFLESDFKRQQAPRRRIILQTESGYKCGMRIAPYVELNKTIWDLLNAPINTELKFNFKPRAFNRQLSNALKLIIREQVDTISNKTIDIVKLELINYTKSTVSDSLKSPEEWIESVHSTLMSEISTQLVRPMLSLIDEALSKQSYSQVDSIYNAEVDLVERIASPLNEVLTEILARYSAKRDVSELAIVCNERLNINFVKNSLIEYFEMFASSDAFLEFRDIETYSSTAEGMQLYLYVGSIKYGSSTYPMFYIPIDSQYDEAIKGFKLEISSHIYANKRAFDFILQELSERSSKQWISPIKERITYVGAEQSILELINPLLTKVQEGFGLLDDFEFKSGPVQQLSDTNVSINNALHICAFEKSDEALLNDYEEMLSQARNNEEGVIALFQGIIDGVLTQNPKSIESSIDKQWDEMSIEQRVVHDSPIPLNEEQIKIINAIDHQEGKFIVVEGPPGTGKSHTIVAIAAACAFKNKSCLVLSDKKEALEVVQRKLSNTMNEVRGDDNFPNPLLRLGTEQANFRKLTSQQVLTQVQAHSKAIKASQNKVENERNTKRAGLKESITNTIDSLGGLKTSDIVEIHKIESQIENDTGINLSIMLDDFFSDSVIDVDENLNHESILLSQLEDIFKEKNITSLGELQNELRNRYFVSVNLNKINLDKTKICNFILEENINRLSELLTEYHGLKMPIIGYLLRNSQIAQLNLKIQNLALFNKQINLKTDVNELETFLTELRLLVGLIREFGNPKLDFGGVYSLISKPNKLSIHFKDLFSLVREINESTKSTLKNELIGLINSRNFPKTLINLLKYYQKLRVIKSHFDRAPVFDYVGLKTEVEKLNTTLMNSEVDERLINFMQNSKTDAKVLAKLIKDKQKFPEEKFDSVKEAFPVIIASIREFGEFMPLKSDIFDVLVIDEASQVSVAQAFPALLRAKKVVVMGDSKQFSNTKSSNASISLNEKYRSDLNSFFKKQISNDVAMLERLSYFDVKRSILEFCQMCSNYSIMLRKHFRSYQELISYSSKNFYNGQLQAIKIRGVPISDVIEFTELKEDIDATRNTNTSEAEFILEKCIELLNEDTPPTVGIITPFNEQQTLISKLFSNHSLYQEFKEKLHLKIMTFDSCQGEERNIIFYSMVATKENDKLNYIFPVSLEDAQELVEHKLKIQRLNVGFSRAQEMIWFVISKPIHEFKGSIGQALKHYDLILKTNKATHDQTDPLSPMESKVLDWIYSSQFYQVYEENIELLPQFPIGDYLKQLDPTYTHPAYKVDFLLTFNHEKGTIHVVIEYDGFEYHFKKDKEIDIGNHERYLTDSDIERQLTLESYGYKFIRINRFNLGADPVVTLSDRLSRLVDLHFQEETNHLVRNLQNQASSLINKSAKQCPICNQIKELVEYFDHTLAGGKGGYGRNCLSCKRLQSTRQSNSPKFRRRKWR